MSKMEENISAPEEEKIAVGCQEGRALAGEESAPPLEEKEQENGAGLEEALERARAEAAENYDRFLRARAELDNYRKRTARMRNEARDETLREVLLHLAPVLDNMRRALVPETQDIEALKQGIELIYGQFQEALKSKGLEEIEVVGKPFDPALHEALMEVENDRCPPGTVVEEVDRGYSLRGQVVRPARVVVSKAGGDKEK